MHEKSTSIQELPAKDVWNDLKPCLPGKELWQQEALHPLLVSFEKLISAPSDVYNESYVTTLHCFMEYCQAMPLDVANPELYGLVKRQLHLVLAVLKCRRGKMLPRHSESETIAEQEPLWTYALFTVSLFWKLPDIQKDRTIELYRNKSEKLGIWHPISASLYESDTCYQIQAAPHSTQINANDIRTLLIGKVIPSSALRWLATNASVFAPWWDAMMQRSNATDNVFLELVEEVAKKMGYLSVPEEKMADETVDQTVDQTAILDQNPLSSEENAKQQALLAFNRWIDKTIKAGKKLSFFRMEAGLFIRLDAVAAFIQEHSEYQSVEQFMEFLDQFLLKEESNRIFRYRSVNFTDRTVMEGIMLDNRALTEITNTLLIQTDFILANSW